MKMYLISDNIDTWTGMRLSGVEGAVVHTREELKGELDRVLADKEVGIILLTEKFGREFPEIIDNVKLERKLADCRDSGPPRNRPQAGLYHLVCERSYRIKTVIVQIEKAGDGFDNRGKTEAFSGYLYDGCQGEKCQGPG